MFDQLHDARVRAAAFDWLVSQVDEHGDVLPRAVLAAGFDLYGTRVPLLGPQGIFKPRILDLPLSITTAPRGPYDDAFGRDDVLHYRYRGANPDHRDNVGLREVMRRGLPLAYFFGLVPGKYLATWPVFIVRDDPAGLTFTVQVDDAEHIGLGTQLPLTLHDASDEGRRRYITGTVRRRLHQRAFRERVIEAYRSHCAFCRFRHEELLDAAHIIPDAEPEGAPSIPNGLALCKLHHGAFDRHFIGVRPDRVLQVRPDILAEEDGPTLVHSIQELHGARLYLPRRRDQYPSEDRLAARYERFLQRAKAS
jgi:putative restriction endonuclease